MKNQKTNNEWELIGKRIDSQNLKKEIYDDQLIKFIEEEIKDRKVLDFGSGTAEIAKRIQKLCSEIKCFDKSKEMRRISKEKIGKRNVYSRFDQIRENYFDIIMCNLVLCIIDEKELEKVMTKFNRSLKKEGFIFIGLCNPKDFDVKENSFQIRHLENKDYNTKHKYRKTIKLLNDKSFTITEIHRPLEFYAQIFKKYKFKIINKTLSKGENVDERICHDFIIYKLKKK